MLILLFLSAPNISISLIKCLGFAFYLMFHLEREELNLHFRSIPYFFLVTVMIVLMEDVFYGFIT